MQTTNHQWRQTNHACGACVSPQAALDVVLPFSPTKSVNFSDAGNYCSYVAHSGGRGRVVMMQRATSLEGLTLSDTRPGIWFGSEIRTDAQGERWSRSIGSHVQDDFGLLVPAPVAASSLKWVQS
jgi:hypothetical protein